MSAYLAAAMAYSLAAWTLTSCRFGGENPVLGKPWHHVAITEEAVQAAGWSAKDGDRSPVAVLAWHCDAVDSYNYNPKWWAEGGWDRFRAALLHKAELDKLHFDDLTSTAQVLTVWRRYLGGTVAGLLWCAQQRDVTAARHVVGAGLHGLQDFYSHSNWVDDPARRTQPWAAAGTKGSMPTPDDPRQGLHLYTGAYTQPSQLSFKPHGKYSLDCSVMQQLPGEILDTVCSAYSPLSNTEMCQQWRACQKGQSAGVHVTKGITVPQGIVYMEPAGMALDAQWMNPIAAQVRLGEAGAGVDLFSSARDLAVQATTGWLKELDQIMARTGHGDFWEDVKTQPSPVPAGKGADLQQFEQSWRWPFGFLTAGHYPPAPREADDGWYLRVDLTTGGDHWAGLAGTDADISLSIPGTRLSFPLDHMSERTPQGGTGQNRLLEWNDFERGSHDTYYVGPVDRLPTSLVLHNKAGSVANTVAVAWEEFRSWVTTTLNELGESVLSLWAGGADRVGSAKHDYDPFVLESLASKGQETITLTIDNREEGKYSVDLEVTAAPIATGLQVSVRALKLHCHRESKNDRWSGSDEPFFHLLVHSPLQPQTESATCAPFHDVDSGETRDVSMDTVVVTVPRMGRVYGGLIIGVQMWESDDENKRMRADAARAYREGFNRRDVNERNRFIDAIGALIAPDWQVASMDVYAFRRGPVVQVAPLVAHRALNTWVGGNTSLTVPCGAPAVTTVSTEVVPLPQGVVSQGTSVVKGTYLFDLDAGASATADAADLWWRQADGTTRFLEPKNGALVTRLGPVDLDRVTPAELARVQLDATPINGSDTSANLLTPGTVLAFRTNQGNLAKVRVDSYGYDLRITWVTYEPPPSPTPAPGQVSAGSTVLQGTFMFDFDAGVMGGQSPEADVWWQQVDPVTRRLVPRGGALLALVADVGFDQLDATALARQAYQGSGIDGSNNAGNRLTAGTVLAVRTSNGNLAKVRVDSYGYDLGITWVTYEPAPQPAPQPEPAPQPPPQPTPEPGPAPARTHTVQPGETLWKIATLYYSDGKRWTDIAAANGIDRPESLKVGQVLVLPDLPDTPKKKRTATGPKRSHPVAAGRRGR